ncbi:hypothetical protein B1992_13190 [Pseudoxanthomonas broegbernensis]|uniref:Uncharacterized protein n=1 Tax=Pseudoxanthomonas broegbernensis TaxID=83619 RepID=A0A7V8K5Z1_9GAMM|nr:hypothetical protein [Pseudoxanthomonas broegbernensis]KAF1685073.1 hypothetical protein B1992_13190 [Pseudoxanthomonas broegbernensis]MBB6066269.1 nitrogen fixation-related uncharacterized protein [Pseudoxanthomonas broegbernensis]
MSLVFPISILAFACVTAFYLYAFFRFYGIVKSERPDWLQVRGSLSFFYDGLSRAGDPNVQMELLRIAFGSRAGQLRTPMAASYAKRIRYLLPVGLVLFVVGLVGALASAP